jgi:hypothetical protein
MAISRILIVKLSSLGDVVHGVPVAGALRRRRCRVPCMETVSPERVAQAVVERLALKR